MCRRPISKRPWSDLPLDLLLLIGSRLSLPHLACMSAVCRGWRSIRHQILPLPGPSWLMTFHQRDNHGLFEVFDPSRKKKKTYKFFLPELSYSWVLSSAHGWLLLCRDDLDLVFFFFNPITRQIKNLPPPDLPPGSEPSCFKAAFSAPPTSPDCMVVVISTKHSQYQILHPGTELWAPPCHGILLPAGAQQPFFCGGRLWCSGGRRDIVMIDPVENKWVVIETRVPGFLNCWQQYLTGFEGELFLISVREETNVVFKLTQSLEAMDADEIKSWGGRTLYLGSTMAMMGISRERGMENKIYSIHTRRYKGYSTYTEQIWIEPNDSPPS